MGRYGAENPVTAKRYNTENHGIMEHCDTENHGAVEHCDTEHQEISERYGVECCDTEHVHTSAVERVRESIPDEDTLYDLTELFRIFGDSTRVRILYALWTTELCVCDIAAVLGISQSAVSHQLRALKNVRLVKARRDGRTVYYSLDDSHVQTMIGQGLEHVREKRL